MELSGATERVERWPAMGRRLMMRVLVVSQLAVSGECDLRIRLWLMSAVSGKELVCCK
jgi:hypothetical protein